MNTIVAYQKSGTSKIFKRWVWDFSKVHIDAMMPSLEREFFPYDHRYIVAKWIIKPKNIQP